MTGSAYFAAQPPCENPPRVSSSGRAGACMTPSRETLMNTWMSVMTSPLVHIPCHARSVRWPHESARRFGIHDARRRHGGTWVRGASGREERLGPAWGNGGPAAVQGRRALRGGRDPAGEGDVRDLGE